jgi:hypothetical protein
LNKDSYFVQFILIFIAVFSVLSLYKTLSKIEELNGIVKSQVVKIEKLTELDKAQNVIMNKLEKEYKNE